MRLEQVRRLLYRHRLRRQDRPGVGRQDVQDAARRAQRSRLRRQEAQILAARPELLGVVLVRHDGVRVGLYGGGRAHRTIRSPHRVRGWG